MMASSRLDQWPSAPGPADGRAALTARRSAIDWTESHGRLTPTLREATSLRPPCYSLPVSVSTQACEPRVLQCGRIFALRRPLIKCQKLAIGVGLTTGRIRNRRCCPAAASSRVKCVRRQPRLEQCAARVVTRRLLLYWRPVSAHALRRRDVGGGSEHPMALALAGGAQAALPTLQLIDLACRRGDRVLFEGVHLSVAAGRVVWLRGSQRARQDEPAAPGHRAREPGEGPACCGTASRSARARDIAAELVHIGHANALKEDLTVTESLAFLARIHGRDASARRCSARSTVRPVSRRRAPVRTLSQGQRRRVALARLALESRPGPVGARRALRRARCRGHAAAQCAAREPPASAAAACC